MIEIKSLAGKVLYTAESAADVRAALAEAAEVGVDLQDADLQGVDLQGAYLQDAYLQGAYLRGAEGLRERTNLADLLGLGA